MRLFLYLGTHTKSISAWNIQTINELRFYFYLIELPGTEPHPFSNAQAELCTHYPCTSSVGHFQISVTEAAETAEFLQSNQEQARGVHPLEDIRRHGLNSPRMLSYTQEHELL